MPFGHQAEVPAPALPADVRLMQATANAVLALLVLGLLAAGVQRLARLPLFNIQAIRIDGDVARNSETTIRANAAPRLAGSFLTLDLQQARAAFEAVPWVRHAVVQRVWPGRAGRAAGRACAGCAVAGHRRQRPPGQHPWRGVRGQPGRRGRRQPARNCRAPTAAPRPCWPCCSGCSRVQCSRRPALMATWRSWRCPTAAPGASNAGQRRGDRAGPRHATMRWIDRTQPLRADAAAGGRPLPAARWPVGRPAAPGWLCGAPEGCHHQ